MATYYVRPDGSDVNTGLGYTAALAWRTVQKALGATGIGSGDTLYIAPGTYTENITVGGTYSATTSVIGDVLCTQFIGVTPGFVKISNYSNENTAPANTNNLLDATSKAFLSFDSIYFQGGGGGNNNIINCITCNNFTWTRCIFQQNINYAGVNGSSFYWTTTAVTASNLKIRKCVFVGHTFTFWINGVNVTDTFEMSDCLVIGNNTSLVRNIQGLIINCTFYRTALSASIGNASFPLKIRNTIVANVAGTGISGTGTAYIDDDYNRVIGCQAAYSGVTVGPNSKSVGTYGLSLGFETMVGLNPIMVLSPEQSSANVNSGTNTDAPVSDIYGATWTSINRDIGDAAFRAVTGTGFYIPTERNASTITIAPGSTSQSIELYLGATGITASTSGLSARYNRTRTASVDIPLVARTIAQAWTSGGFAEVDATNMPGVYRLDVPDAALAAGADDVTIVVRGASGTNGAVMTVKLSSGGLTSAQTAAAVLDAVGTSYTTAGSIGYAIQNSNVASISGSTAAADELEGALLHNGTDYISAELVTPVTSAALVRMGPYEVKADGLGASDPLDIQKGAQHGVDIQCVDGNGNGIDITSATVTAKVYNSGATLVDTYACTATYAADGRATFTIDTTVTDTPGTYTATITRTTGASDTQIFGPLRIYVRDI
jgi:hypothetical protein